MSILTPRFVYGPFEYPEAFSFYLKQKTAFWSPYEVSMGKDIMDYKTKLNDSERHLIGNVLKGFVASEVVIKDIWSNKICKYFPKPEIVMMATAFSFFETIHMVAYAYLEESLGLQNHEAFLHEPAAKAKIDRLLNIKGNSKADIARCLAVFSAFTEGVSLFSSFAILYSFSQRNLLKGVGQLISWSSRDENLHSVASIWLFNELVKEFPELMTDELKKDIYDAARLTIQLEDNFIDKCFELGPIEGLDPKDLKNYMRFRANTKLQALGLKSNWKNIDKESLKRLDWFDVLTTGTTSQDFFDGSETFYSRNIVDFSDIWSNENE